MEVALFCFCFISTWQITFQNLLTRNGHGPPQLKDYEHTENNDRLYRHYQAIVPTYNLSCCGNIIEWGLDVFEDQIRYILDLQVWRSSPTVDDSTGTGCYSLVGNNRFNISLSEEVAKVTPSPQDYIQFQPGDVLGFYIEEAIAKNTNNKPPGVVLRTSPSYLTSEIVWFASLNHEAATSQNGDCLYSVGSNDGVLNTLTQAAPVISISITSIPCSPSVAISETNMKSILSSMHSPANNIASSSKTTIMVGSTLPINTNISSSYSMSSGIPSNDKSTTNKHSHLPEKKIILIVMAVILTFTILIIAMTFMIVILLRSRKKSCKGKQRKPWECVSQQGISNQAYFEPLAELQSQTNEGGIEIVPAHNGEAVIYHCIGPSTSRGKTPVSDSEQPEIHHYFELEALPTHQYADIDQLSTVRDKDKIAAKSGKSMPVYEDVICSQQFQDFKEYESELKDESNETGVYT